MIFIVPAAAQVIDGRVEGPDGGVAGADVELLDMSGRVWVGRCVTDGEGRFRLDADTARRVIYRVRALGYQGVRDTADVAAFPAVIRLAALSQALREAEVRASRYVPTATGYRYRMQELAGVRGRDALHSLAVLPGIVLHDGTLLLNGAPVNTIYINGRRIINRQELEAIPAEYLSMAEVEYFDMSGSGAGLAGGCLRLRLARLPDGYYYGGVSARTEEHPGEDCGHGRYHNVGMASVRVRRWNFYDNLSQGHLGLKWRESNGVDYAGADGTADTEDVLAKQFGENRVSNQLGVVCDLTERRNVGLAYYLDYLLDRPHATVDYRPGRGVSDERQRVNLGTHQLTAAYNVEWGERANRAELTAEYMRRGQKTDVRSFIYNNVWEEDGFTHLTNRSVADMWVARSALSFPLGRVVKLRWNAAVNYTVQRYRPDVTEYGVRPAVGTQLGRAMSRGLMPSTFVAVTGRWRSLFFSAGVNAQLNYTDYDGEDRGYRFTQWNVSPRVSVKRTFGEKDRHSVDVGYYRLMDDVPYDAITTKREWKNAALYTVGNPVLKAPAEHHADVRLQFFGEKLGIFVNAYRNTNEIHYETREDSMLEGVFFTQPVNIGGETGGQFAVDAKLAPASWWVCRLAARYELARNRAVVSGVDCRRVSNHFVVNSSQIFTFCHDWSLTVNGYFEPTYRTYDRTYYRVWNAGMDAYKTWRKKFTLSLSADYLRPRVLRTHLPGHDLVYRNRTSGFRCSMTLSWRFDGGLKRGAIKELSRQQEYDLMRDTY